MIARYGLLWFLVLAALLPPRGNAATFTLQQGVNGYTGTTDAWLERGNGGNDNHGGSALTRIRYNNIYRDTTVLKFDLTGQIPANQRIMSAVLEIWYVDEWSMLANNALTLEPFRLIPGTAWYENIYEDQNGVGVSWTYRDAGETLLWTMDPYTANRGGWGDKADDGNSAALIKRLGGSVPGAIEPQHWVSFNVTYTVRNWYAGTENNGFVIGVTAFQGGGYDCYGLFTTSEDSLTAYRPKLTINYEPVPEPAGLAGFALTALAAVAWRRVRRGSREARAALTAAI